MDPSAEARLDDRVHAAVRATIRILGLVALAAFTWLAHDVLLLAFFAIVLAVVMSYPVGWLSRVMPRGAGVLVVLLLGVGAAVGLGVIAAPTVSAQIEDIQQSAPRAIEKARQRLRALYVPSEPGGGAQQGRSGARGQGRPAEPGHAEVDGAVVQAAATAAPAAFRLIGSVAEIVLLVVLAAFLVHEPEIYRGGIRLLVPREHEDSFDELWRRLRENLRRWVGGIVVEMVILGALTAVGLFAVGVQNWLVLGLVTGLGTFVPYLGAVASAVPGLLVALAQSPRHLLLAAAVYLGVHVVEGYILSPYVMRRAVAIRPALLLAGQAVLGAVFGVLGIVVATPVIVCAQIAVTYLWVERRLQKRAG